MVEVRFVPVIAAPELTYPIVPSPCTVDCKENISCVEETYPAVPNPLTVDCNVESRVGVLSKPTAEERYPAVPNPLTVDCNVESRVGVLSKPTAEERYPAVPNPLTVDVSCVEEIYPNVPNPCVVLTKLLANPRLLIKFSVPRPTIVDVNSVGSINEEISVCRAIVVLCSVLAR